MTVTFEDAPTEVRAIVEHARSKPERYHVWDWPTGAPRSALFPNGIEGEQTGWSIGTESMGITVWLGSAGCWKVVGDDDEGYRFLTDDLAAAREWFESDPDGVQAMVER